MSGTFHFTSFGTNNFFKATASWAVILLGSSVWAGGKECRDLFNPKTSKQKVLTFQIQHKVPTQWGPHFPAIKRVSELTGRELYEAERSANNLVMIGSNQAARLTRILELQSPRRFFYEFIDAAGRFYYYVNASDIGPGYHLRPVHLKDSSEKAPFAELDAEGFAPAYRDPQVMAAQEKSLGEQFRKLKSSTLKLSSLEKLNQLARLLATNVGSQSTVKMLATSKKKIDQNLVNATTKMLGVLVKNQEMTDAVVQEMNHLVTQGLALKDAEASTPPDSIPFTSERDRRQRLERARMEESDLINVKQYAGGVVRGTIGVSLSHPRKLSIDLRTYEMQGGSIGLNLMPAKQVPKAFKEVLARINRIDESSTLLEIAQIYRDLIFIHPFTNGNGRTTRILVLFCLMKAGYLPPAEGHVLPAEAVFTTPEMLAHDIMRSYWEKPKDIKQGEIFRMPYDISEPLEIAPLHGE